MNKGIHITINDYHKIVGLIEMAGAKSKLPEIARRLLSNLNKATMTSQVNIAKSIVTMNSRVLLKDTLSGRESTITITYPHDANPIKGKISVFTPAGVALLGCKEGDIASWTVPDGIGHFKVEKILYQPEAAGDYHL